MAFKSFIHPPYLKKGDTIGIVCPAGFMSLERVQTCIKVLHQWGYKVKLGKTVGNQFHYFSGTDVERLNDLQSMLDDASVKAILCGRGGYGTSRIIDEIDWKAFKKNPKWIIGFSDITVLHSFLFTKLKTASLHAPMAAAFNNDARPDDPVEQEYRNPYVQSLKNALAGNPAHYKTAGSEFNRKGIAEGQLVGGNLSLLVHQIGTASDINTKGKILFLEDLSEYLYHIDRMMVQLKRSRKLNGLAGLIIGGFTDLKDTTTPFGKTVEEIILDHVRHYNYPVCFHFPVSHEKENYALKIGAIYKLEVKKTVMLKEIKNQK